MRGINYLEFSLGDLVSIEGRKYEVIGIIIYQDGVTREVWKEYKLREKIRSKIKWLSIDNKNDEYALYEKNRSITKNSIVEKGYHEVDRGIAEVYSYLGNVDVELNETVRYEEYEDESEENIISVEVWDDETEYSTGYYLNSSDILKINDRVIGSNYKKTNKNFNLNIIKGFGALIIIFIVAISFLIMSNDSGIHEYLYDSPEFSYVTSITSDLKNEEKADVFQTTLSVDSVAKLIIDNVYEKVEDVQQSEEDSSVAIITEDEYCIVYSDIDDVNNTLVQVSSRLYTYTSNESPYHSNTYVSSYYRSYYYSRGYTSDSERYDKYTTSYKNFDGDYIDKNINDNYRTYSNSIRQSSVYSRSSSGGGTGFGK